MKSFAMALDLKNDFTSIEEYKKYHRDVWPEVLDGLKKINISRMKIFLHGCRLFMYIEAPDDFDLRRDFQNYMKSERAKEWDFIMRKFQEPVPGAEPDEWWSPMEEVFSLES